MHHSCPFAYSSVQNCCHVAQCRQRIHFPCHLETLKAYTRFFPLCHNWYSMHQPSALPHQWIASRLAQLDAGVIAADTAGKVAAFLNHFGDLAQGRAKEKWHQQRFQNMKSFLEMTLLRSVLDCVSCVVQECADQSTHKMAGYLIHCDDPLIKSYSDLDGVA